MNGVEEWKWTAGQFKVTAQDIVLRSVRRDADGYFTGTISAQIELELPDGRRVLLNDARPFRGRCLNAKRGRKKAV